MVAHNDGRCDYDAHGATTERCAAPAEQVFMASFIDDGEIWEAPTVCLCARHAMSEATVVDALDGVARVLPLPAVVVGS